MATLVEVTLVEVALMEVTLVEVTLVVEHWVVLQLLVEGRGLSLRWLLHVGQLLEEC